MNAKILFVLATFCFACDRADNPEDPVPATFQQLKVTKEYKAIEGTDANLLSLDIYYREDTTLKKPVVVYVHGGAWSTGDKGNSIQNKRTLFESLNYVFVSVNYRLSPSTQANSTPDRIKFPVHNTDVADAVKWVVEHIDQYGGSSEKIALLGHSAGAHLVSLTGTNAAFLKQAGYDLSVIKGVATIDTEGYDVRAKVLEGNEIYINAFGTVEQENRDASPLYNVVSGRSYPKFFIAKRGTAKRQKISEDFIQALRSVNTETYEIEASTYTHNGINEAIGKEGETLVTTPLKEFFEVCFK